MTNEKAITVFIITCFLTIAFGVHFFYPKREKIQFEVEPYKIRDLTKKERWYPGQTIYVSNSSVQTRYVLGSIILKTVELHVITVGELPVDSVVVLREGSCVVLDNSTYKIIEINMGRGWYVDVLPMEGS